MQIEASPRVDPGSQDQPLILRVSERLWMALELEMFMKVSKNLKSALFALALLSPAAALADAAPSNCLFGEEVGELFENPRLAVSKSKLKTLKLSRVGSRADRDPISFEVTSIRDKKTGREYQLNLTFRHADDGDNAWGWIEEVTDAFEDNGKSFPEVGGVVAVIGDSFIDKCSVER